ncbi:RsmB/NOP family class I SAM-dependent RNA methyltransferase [Candidatus Saccharibacteria bacterium TM7i]|nr:RsmB/NOP family class I SAM-dependent RNA methyltransferase [Candidatus Saccharibacteria bacterium TM7i]
MGKRRTLIDRRTYKRNQLVERTRQALQLTSDDEAIELLRIGRRQAVRINPLKGSVDDSRERLNSLLGDTLSASPLYEYGYLVDGDLSAVRDSRLQQEGYVYIQNAASWLPVLQLNPQPDEVVLDMCAAPGGKTSLIAAMSQNKAQITANDNSRPRLMRLKANMERLGADIEQFTLYDASSLTRSLAPEMFDKILLDAPCSGEGMMQYDTDKDFDSWSTAHVKRLGKLQRKLIMQAWELLKPGGTLIYSTCTMAPEENEAVIDYLLRHVNGAAIVRHDYPEAAGFNRVSPVLSWGEKRYDHRIADTLRLAPSVSAEAFYVCHLRKASEDAINP